MKNGQKLPHPIDQHVGGRVRQRRMFIGMSQEQLGERLTLTFQQIQKYEKGTNRISASRLWEMSKILEVPIDFFFDGGDASGAGSIAPPGELAEKSQDPFQVGSESERLRLNRYFVRINDPKLRRTVIDLAKSLAGAELERLESV